MLMDFFQKIKLHFQNNTTVPLEKQHRFLKRLYQLLNNGYSLLNSLNLMKLEKDLKEISIQVKFELSKGVQLSKVLKKVNFHPLITNYLATVETSGDLKDHVRTCIKLTEQRLQYIKQSKKLMRYPAILLIFFLAIFFIINYFVLPSFRNFFPEQAAANFSVHLIINTIKGFGFIMITLAGCVYLCYLFRHQISRMFSVMVKINILTKIPFLNTLSTLHYTLLFSTQLSTLLQSGMTIKDVLEHLAKQSQLPIISYYSSLLTKEIITGGDLVSRLEQFKLLDKQLAYLFKTNTNMQDLAKDLRMYEYIIFDELEQRVMKAISLIQPFLFTLLALFIISMYFVIMWPMFDLINHI